jgi:hypothetical protein
MENNQDEAKMIKKIKDKTDILHKDYRGASVALSATIITLSTVVIYKLFENYNTFNFPLTCLLFLILISFFAALFIQYFHILGYMHAARGFYHLYSMYYQKGINERVESVKLFNSELKKSQELFDKMDITVKMSFWIFSISILVFIIVIFKAKV